MTTPTHAVCRHPSRCCMVWAEEVLQDNSVFPHSFRPKAILQQIVPERCLAIILQQPADCTRMYGTILLSCPCVWPQNSFFYASGY
ncbi:expressed unknown protein [Seminavis robusta]|uniref:Uncharacterized protein n=1 Tax=Seminavis robusta TaxID=568900 RepID=A0A9N8H781_9STRA|nr:expressed unknown protein [Seminavis robusta]|eukprot:Sro62_g035500.1 n/a (86) ;mRNA; r:106170-106511